MLQSINYMMCSLMQVKYFYMTSVNPGPLCLTGGKPMVQFYAWKMFVFITNKQNIFHMEGAVLQI